MKMKQMKMEGEGLRKVEEGRMQEVCGTCVMMAGNPGNSKAGGLSRGWVDGVIQNSEGGSYIRFTAWINCVKCLTSCALSLRPNVAKWCALALRK